MAKGLALTDAKGLDLKSMLDGIELERNDNNFNFVYPNGARRSATMPEVLMWELLRELRRKGCDASER